MTDRPQEIDEVLEARIQEKFKSGVPIGEVILFMREAGLFVIPSIKMVRKYMGVSLGQAQDIVHESPVWYGEKKDVGQSEKRDPGKADTNRRAFLLEVRRTISEAQKTKTQMENLATR